MGSSNWVPTEEIYLGRQPILDRSQSLYAFELLFRSKGSDKANVVDHAAATSEVILDTLSAFGMEAILGRYAGFINCDAAFLQSDVIELLPPEKTVLEIIRTAKADEAIVRRCLELKEKGFRLALDNFRGITPENQGFLDLVDIIKVDIQGLSEGAIKQVVAQIKDRKVVLLAEKVETQEAFHCCLELGFNLYQGYFFSQVERVAGKRFTTSQAAIMQVLGVLQVETDVSKIVEAFKRNPALSVGLLRLTNSASVGLRHEITSIRSAIVLLGQRQLQRWLLLLLVTEKGHKREGRQTVLVHQAAARAKFMELLALSDQAWASLSESAFIAGMVSVMEALLGMEMDVLVESLGLVQEVRDALVDRKGILGDLLNLVEAIERDDGRRVDVLVDAMFKGKNDLLVKAQGQTIAWVNQIIDAGT
ncbi:MAG: HDOD domain-containing protein [Alistipes senegalensis]|nr:HDOD domain-containing protein [Oxalobacter formigenes]MCM1281811.1 HDOD domain-containing protein [Alistipes senegalensis]